MRSRRIRSRCRTRAARRHRCPKRRRRVGSARPPAADLQSWPTFEAPLPPLAVLRERGPEANARAPTGFEHHTPRRRQIAVAIPAAGPRIRSPMSQRLSLALLLLFAVACPGVGADDWPQWLGPQRDGVWREQGILSEFPKDGPRVRWRVPVGGGYAG